MALVLFQTAPINFSNKTLTPDQLILFCLDIESLLQSMRKVKWGSVKPTGGHRVYQCDRVTAAAELKFL